MTVDILTEATELLPELIEIRRELHQNPGVGFEIPTSLAIVERELTALGIPVTRCGQAGLVGLIGVASGPCILLRADMDALPLEEATELSFASQNGMMHACGHDLHTTMLLGAAKLLKRHEAQLKGQVKLMFQPAEEIMAGARDMIAAGVLTAPQVDAAAMIHVAPGLPLDDGTVIQFPAGIAMASSDWLEIKIKGKSGHGSTPANAIDPMIPLAQIILGLQAIATRELTVDEKIALTFGEIHGGVTSNVIAEEVVLKGTLRTTDNGVRAKVKTRIEELVINLAAAHRCQGEVLLGAGSPTLLVDEALEAFSAGALPTYLPEGKFQVLPAKNDLGTVMASEDFAYISQEVPSLLLNLGAADSRVSEAYPLHHPQVVFNEASLPYGVTAFVGLALSYLTANN